MVFIHQGLNRPPLLHVNKGLSENLLLLKKIFMKHMDPIKAHHMKMPVIDLLW